MGYGWRVEGGGWRVEGGVYGARGKPRWVGS
jgi:hypothetical protein